jgi:hypothetical protein
MSVAFAPERGAVRAHLDELQWAQTLTAADLADAGLGALGVLPGHPASADEVEPTVVEAARLAVGRAPVHVDVVATGSDRAVVASWGSHGRSAAGVARALVVDAGAGPAGTTLVPGVELSAVPVEHLVTELVRLVPPDGPLVPSEPPPPVVVPLEQALVLAAALRDGDDALVDAVKADRGWAELPELPRALADGVRAHVTTSVRVAGRPGVVVRRWLQTSTGWVQLALDGDRVVHTASSRDGLAQELLYTLTGAFEAALTGEDGR